MTDITEQELKTLIDHIEAGREVAAAWKAAGGVAESHNTLSPTGPLAMALARLADAQLHEAALHAMVNKIRARQGGPVT